MFRVDKVLGSGFRFQALGFGALPLPTCSHGWECLQAETLNPKGLRNELKVTFVYIYIHM